jgi:hypothetical protein
MAGAGRPRCSLIYENDVWADELFVGSRDSDEVQGPI